MRTAKVGGSGSGVKRKSTGAPKSVDEYLARVPEPARGTLSKIRATIRAAVPAEASEVISHGMPVFKWKGVLVYYAAFSDHCSLFPTAAVIEAFKKELQGYITSKGTIQFSAEKGLPAGLVRKMVRARVRMIESEKRG